MTEHDERPAAAGSHNPPNPPPDVTPCAAPDYPDRAVLRALVDDVDRANRAIAAASAERA